MALINELKPARPGTCFINPADDATLAQMAVLQQETKPTSIPPPQPPPIDWNEWHRWEGLIGGHGARHRQDLMY